MGHTLIAELVVCKHFTLLTDELLIYIDEADTGISACCNDVIDINANNEKNQ